MKYLTFSEPEQTSYEICFLAASLHSADMRRIYVEPHFGSEPETVLAYDLFKGPKTTKAALQRDYLDDLLPVLEDLQVKYLVTCDAEYFKTLTKKPKAEGFLGHVLPSTCGRFHVAYCPNYRTVYLNPDKVKDDIRIALSAVKAHRAGTYSEPGSSIIRFEDYPQTVAEIASWLDRLVADDRPLAADIETFSLRHHEAGIGTISFAWSQHEGIAFPVDLHPEASAIRELLRDFFVRFPNRTVWHNISFDAYILVYQLFMEDLLDTEGLITGLEVLLKNWDCTKLITYLATNSCAGNKLGLKVQGAEYAGDYAEEDIKDIRQIPLDALLRYNLTDTLATWFVYDKHWPTVIADNQRQIYEELFKPAVWDIIQMQLTGLPLDMAQVGRVKAALQEIDDDALARLRGNPYLTHVEIILANEWAEKRNAELKVKRVTAADWKEKFNPNSGPQLQRLLYEVMELPVLDKTDTGQPATGGDTLEKLVNHTTDPDILSFLDALVDHKAVDKILGSFIPAFEKAPQAPDGWHYLFGSFNLGGTVSGRLSSSKPNLQNLPANVSMAPSAALLTKLEDVLGPYVSKGKLSIGKLIKSCFKAPPGFLLIGLDFASLEDRISALTTRDPNKLKVYTDGYDGHSLRAHSYFGEQMPDIETAPDGARCFRATVGEKSVLFHEHETVSYLGQEMTGLELWERLANVRKAA